MAPAIAGGEEEPQPAKETTTVTDSAGVANIEKWAARFKGSSLTFDQSITPDTLVADVQLSPVPSYQWWFSLRPRYNFTPDLSLRLRLDLTVEWTTGGAETTYLHEPQFGDIWTDLAYSGIPKFGGIDTTVALRLLFPTSKSSIARGTFLFVGGVLGFNREFETRAGDFGISLAGAAGYTFGPEVGHLAPGVRYDCADALERPQTCDSQGGKTNAYAQFTGSIGVKYVAFKRLTFGLAYILIDQWRYKVEDTTLPNGEVIGTGPNDTRLNTAGWFLANVDFDVLKWLNLSLGYYTYRSILDPGGQYGNPFWQPGGGSRIFLSTTFSLDGMYTAIAMRGRRNPVAESPPAPATRF